MDRLNNCNLTADCYAGLGSALYEISNLKILSLCNNELQDAGMKLLASGLNSEDCKLETLMLSYCKVRIEGFESLALALRSNPSYLRVLNLGKNYPESLGLKLLFIVLENTVEHCGLETLKLVT
ncbi:hypothetical protein P4O66_018029 [Electrophorus voltai]|uniref:NACHT LRR and PYD domain-containing protein n=1 Tax=Electrophorus voltai TaxID=2609070 RepID=A0AAD8YTW9_9TELE|nr:hypothetical protein P4O66_018029 [Electrophorus voltai]